MCKKILEEIRLITSSISTLYDKIPKTRIESIKKDVANLTSDINGKSSIELNEIKSLMNAKLKALKRVYGTENFGSLKDDENKSKDKKIILEIGSNKEFTNLSGEKIQLIKSDLENDFLKKKNLIKEEKLKDKLLDSEDESYEWKSSYDEIKSKFFNKENIDKYHKEKDSYIKDLNEKIFQEYKDLLKERVQSLRKNGKLKEINDEFNKIQILDSRWAKKDISGKYTFNKELLKKDIIELFNICFESGGEEYFNNLDLDKIQQNDFGHSSLNNDDYFESISDNFMKPSNEEIDKIKNFNTEIEYVSAGKFKINKYFEEDNLQNKNINDQNENMFEESDIHDKDNISKNLINNSNNSGLNSNNEKIVKIESTREKYVWRNGKLVPGEGAKRKLATIINWNSSNLDPNDVKRHRELLDRQHFSGPLWEGIKKTTLLDEPISINKEDFENNSMDKKEYEELMKKNKGHQNVEEIVR